MSKVAFIFPGQGAQCIGMGQDIIENHKVSEALFKTANDRLDFDLSDLCFSENESIHDTAYTQPALLAVSIAILKVVESLGIKADYTAGLSLGEYSALVASGVLSFDEAIYIVRKRGQFMQEAAKNTDGGMAAIIGSNKEAIMEVINETEGYITIANYNNPKQIVIAGELKALEKSYPKFKAAKIKAIPLKVSGAFHSELMASAATSLEEEFNNITFREAQTPYLTNVSGAIVKDIKTTKELLISQVKSPVLWETCVRTMIDEGVELFIEIGPGKTLAGLIKKIDRKKKVISVSNTETLEQLKRYLEEEKYGA